MSQNDLMRNEKFWTRRPRRLRFASSAFLAALGFLITANLLTIHFVRREHWLYSWDHVTYWSKVTGLTAAVTRGQSGQSAAESRRDHADPMAGDAHGQHDPDRIGSEPLGGRAGGPSSTLTFWAGQSLRAARAIARSIREDDQNALPAVLLLPATVVLGHGRLPYILSIVNVLAFAAAVAFAFLHLGVSRLLKDDSTTLPLISAGIVLLTPAFWHPILYGYPDVGGLAIVSLVLLLYVRTSTSERGIRDSILMALLIPLAIVFRRWYAYWAVAFYAAVVVDRSVAAWLGRLRDPRKALLIIAGQALVSAAFLAVVAPTFALRAVTTRYSDVYSAWRFSGSVLESVARVVDYFGLLFVALFVAGLVQLARNAATRHIAFFLAVQWVIIVYAFSRTQDFGPHHFYLLLPAMLLCAAVFITRLVTRLRLLITVGVLALLLLNVASAFSTEELWYRSAFRHVLTGIRHPPLVRSDIDEVDRMLGVLENVLTEPEDRVYVLSGSAVLNPSMLVWAHLSLNRHREIPRRILRTHLVDRRDGFPEGLLRATYIVAADPVQYQLRPHDQRVMGIPAELVLTARGIGTSLVRLPYAFRLERGVTAYLYKKVRPFSDSDLQALSDMLRHYYPTRPEIYRVSER